MAGELCSTKWCPVPYLLWLRWGWGGGVDGPLNRAIDQQLSNPHHISGDAKRRKEVYVNIRPPCAQLNGASFGGHWSSTTRGAKGCLVGETGMVVPLTSVPAMLPTKSSPRRGSLEGAHHA